MFSFVTPEMQSFAECQLEALAAGRQALIDMKMRGILAQTDSEVAQGVADRLDGYDYKHQAWVRDGVYVACGHPKPCSFCYGTTHEGQPLAADAELN